MPLLIDDTQTIYSPSSFPNTSATEYLFVNQKCMDLNVIADTHITECISAMGYEHTGLFRLRRDFHIEYQLTKFNEMSEYTLWKCSV